MLIQYGFPGGETPLRLDYHSFYVFYSGQILKERRIFVNDHSYILKKRVVCNKFCVQLESIFWVYNIYL